MTAPLKINVLPEPKVEFANGGLEVDPRRGFLKHGPADLRGERIIKLGIVGLPDDAKAMRTWYGAFDRLSTAKEKNSHRYKDWPGFKKALHADYQLDKRHVREVDEAEYRKWFAKARSGEHFDDLLSLYTSKIESLFGDDGPDCILVCIPPELGDLRVANPRLSHEERRALELLREEEESLQLGLFAPSPEELKAAEALYTAADDLLFRTFYRALKARVMLMRNAVPVQVVRRNTIDRPDDKGQSFATRAWHLSSSIYYKAKGVPWRPADLPRNVCFVGITFHHLKKRSGHLVYASVAQAYSTDVEPFALKGASVDQDQKRDRQPYLNAEQAEELLKLVLDAYEAQAGIRPDRVVIHKTSTYQDEEIEGFRNASKDRAPKLDMIWLRNTAFRIVRKGSEEPWRGTHCQFDDRHFLFTNGYVPWWNEFPGAHIPAPIEFGSVGQTDMLARASEILALTKMNWNSSDGIGGWPITILFAKRVGELMSEFPTDADPNPSYRFYI